MSDLCFVNVFISYMILKNAWTEGRAEMCTWDGSADPIDCCSDRSADSVDDCRDGSADSIDHCRNGSDDSVYIIAGMYQLIVAQMDRLIQLVTAGQIS